MNINTSVFDIVDIKGEVRLGHPTGRAVRETAIFAVRLAGLVWAANTLSAARKGLIGSLFVSVPLAAISSRIDYPLHKLVRHSERSFEGHAWVFAKSSAKTLLLMGVTKLFNPALRGAITGVVAFRGALILPKLWISSLGLEYKLFQKSPEMSHLQEKARARAHLESQVGETTVWLLSLLGMA